MQQRVAKLVLIDQHDRYLLLVRNNHPRFGDDYDVPGGTVEGGEGLVEAMVREVQEEAGIFIDPAAVHQLYGGDDYSIHHTYYALFVTRVQHHPSVTLSWEHSSYEWVSREEFLDKTRLAADTFMQMVHDIYSKGEHL